MGSLGNIPTANFRTTITLQNYLEVPGTLKELLVPKKLLLEDARIIAGAGSNNSFRDINLFIRAHQSDGITFEDKPNISKIAGIHYTKNYSYEIHAIRVTKNGKQLIFDEKIKRIRPNKKGRLTNDR